MKVSIPAPLQHYCAGRSEVDAEGKDVRTLIANLAEHYPGLADALTVEEKLRPGIAVAVDGMISHLGVHTSTEDAKRVTFVPALNGG